MSLSDSHKPIKQTVHLSTTISIEQVHVYKMSLVFVFRKKSSIMRYVMELRSSGYENVSYFPT